MNYIIVFIGGGIGSILRYLVSTVAKNFTSISFPFGTLTVNIVGSFLMGIVTALLINKITVNNESIRLLLAVGFLGGFTTFSSFSIETITLIEKHEIFYAIANVMTNLIFSLIAAYCGLTLIRNFIS